MNTEYLSPLQNTLNCNGRLLMLNDPIIMGILNITPDSFYDGGRFFDSKVMLLQVEKMLSEGATIIDIGGMSSRPGAEFVTEEEEKKRVLPNIELIIKHFPSVFLSVDTWRASIASESVAIGASIINDISGGQYDEKLYETLGGLNVPIVLMHVKGTPSTMQVNPQYEDIHGEILGYFVKRIEHLKAVGVSDIILDLGFGFGKTLDQNYELLKNLHAYHVLGLPQLVGVSRKSMIYNFLETTSDEVLNGTSVLHFFALQQKAKILRVHDVKAASEVLKLYQKLL